MNTSNPAATTCGIVAMKPEIFPVTKLKLILG
jgi:hypothetical protein